MAESNFYLNAIESNLGIFVPEHHAKMIITGTKTIIVDAKNYSDIIGKTVYLVGGNDFYGAVKINNIELIDGEKFAGLFEKHKIPEQEAKLLFGSKKKLFAYSIEWIEGSNSANYLVKSKSDGLIGDVLFLSEIEKREIELIKNIINYDPKIVDITVLKNDFRLALAWYCNKTKNNAGEYSIEQILNILNLIIQELKNRRIEFHPEKMQPCAREGFEKALGRSLQNDLSETGFDDFGNCFEDAIIIKDFISIVGSSVERNKYNDVDVLVRFSDTDYIKRAIMMRLDKMFSKESNKKLHFVFEPAGPHDKFVPVYDLQLKRVYSKEIEMSEQIERIKPMKPFKPMKPRKRFYELKEIVDYLYGA